MHAREITYVDEKYQSVKFMAKTKTKREQFKNLLVGEQFEWHNKKYQTVLIYSSSTSAFYAGISLDTSQVVLLKDELVEMEVSAEVEIKDLQNGSFFRYQDNIYLLVVKNNKRIAYPLFKSAIQYDFVHDLKVTEMVLV